MLTSYCFSSKVHAKRDGSSAVNSHLITDRNVKDLSLENVDLILFEYESLYLKVWQFSCHLIIGRNVKDLSLESGKCFTSFCLITKISKFIPKGVAV